MYSDNHKFHHTGEAAYLIEPLDERVSEFLKKSIRSGYKRPKDLQRRPKEFVDEQLFPGDPPQQRYRRKFYPNRRKIKNVIYSVKNELRFSKVDQENLKLLSNLLSYACCINSIIHQNISVDMLICSIIEKG